MLQKGWKLVGVLVTVLLLTVLGGCSSGEKAAVVKKELVFANFRDIRDLNPHLYGGEMYAQSILFEPLVRVSDKGVEPCLAEKWDISPDGKVYTFYIRKGVTFSDGEVLDAKAVKANFDAVYENKDRHSLLDRMKPIQSIEAVDDYTFRITLKYPYYPMLIELGGTRPFAMVSPKAMKNGSTKDGVNAFIGTGPYILSEVATDKYAVFTANEKYWGKPPAIKQITVKVISDNQTRILALQNGEIDLIYGKDMLDADTLRGFKSKNDFVESLSGPISTRHLLMNSNTKVLGDVNVRKAIQHATNKEAISKGIFNDIEKPADTLYSPGIKYCDVGLKPYQYDVAQADALLDQAGWIKGADGIREKGGQKLSFTLLYCSDRVTEKTIAEYLQNEYAKLGIKMDIRGEEEQSYRDNMKAGKFDMVFNIAWGTPQDPQTSMAAMRAPVYGDYAAQLGLPDKVEIDKGITAILGSISDEERQKLFTDVLTRLHEDAVYLPLTYECNKALYRKGLQGVTFDANPYRIPFEKMYY